MKLIIYNKTKYDTKQLKALCKAVIKNTGSHKTHQITIKTGNRSWSYSGRATINGSWILMRIPNPYTKKFTPIIHPTETTIGSDGTIHPKIIRYDKTKVLSEYKFNVEAFAQVLEHEIGHNLGLRHKEMCKVHDINVDYSKDYVVELSKPKEKKKVNHVSLRKEKAEQKVLELSSKIKRYENLLKKWSKKVSYYEKKNII